jgi:hypothetical protein
MKKLVSFARQNNAGLIRVGTIVVASVVVTTMVVSASRAPFTASTSNIDNSVAAGTVTLTDDAASALFTVEGMVPGQTETRCVLVTYDGTVADPAPVRLYSGGYVDSGTFSDYLSVTIEEGTGATFGDCAGFVPDATIESGVSLSAFDAARTDYATGAGGWDPASTAESRAYRISFQLDPATPDAQQGESVNTLVFTWETQN